jgi:hypothetical protein
MIVTGKLSGDCECWCLEVSEEEYRKIVGEETYLLEKRLRKEMSYDYLVEDIWRIYPNDLMAAIGLQDKTTEVSFEIKAR